MSVEIKDMQLFESASNWCVDEQVLHDIYNFSHRPCSASQSTDRISDINSVFTKFNHDLRASKSNSLDNDPPISWPDLPTDSLSRLEAAAEILSSKQVHWFPKYGCAVFALAAMCDHIDVNTRYGDEISILIVGLDSWNFQTHTIAQGPVEHISTCEGSCVLHAGSISVEDTTRFFDILEGLLEKAQTKKKKARSAASNEQGHQKTPSFIDALVQDALHKLQFVEELDLVDSESGNIAHQPRGGFTDVGMHTGGKARSTAWPLFKESLKTVFQYSSVYQSPSAELFECFLAHFYLWLLNRQVALLTPENATQLMVNATMKMLELASNTAAEIVDRGFCLGHAEDYCQNARMQLDAIVLQRAERAAKNFQIHPAESLEFTHAGLKESYVLPKGIVPPLMPASAEDGDMDAARKRAWKNLAPLLLPILKVFEPHPLARILPSLEPDRLFSGQILALFAIFNFL